MARFLVGTATALPNPQDADVNRDGTVTTADAVLIMQFAKGLRTGFDFSAPQALAVVPPDGTADVLLGAGISVFFSEPMSSATLAGVLTLADTVSGQRVAGRIERSQDGVIATFYPDEPLQADRLYRIDVSTVARDLEGNALLAPISSRFRTQPLGSLALVSANDPEGTIDTVLGQAIAVKALSSTGGSVKQVPVLFTAKRGPGLFEPSRRRQVTVLTEDDGVARVSLRLGGQAVLHTVEATAVGFAPAPSFQARALPGPARNLRVFAGNNQNCPTGGTALLPLRVKATDEGGNAAPGVTVTFRVVQGDGSFGGLASSRAVTELSSAVASAVFTHGSKPGAALVEASFDGMVGQPPVFTLLGLEARPSSPTAIVGTVINTDVRPLEGIKVFLAADPAVRDVTDESGSFRLEPVAAGKQLFVIDALGSGPIDGVTYANLEFELGVIQGQDNTIQMPAILPPLDPLSVLDVSAAQGGTLTLRADPRWKLFLGPGQATFPGGGKAGRLFVTQVPSDKIPMAPPEGKIARTFVAIEPPLVRFDPPAQVQFPNSDNLGAGTITEIFSFDHAVGLFVPVGRGQVSEDGTLIRSLPGEGLIHGGWHQAPPPAPLPTTCASGKVFDETRFPVDQCAITVAGLSGLTGEDGLYQLCGIPAIGPVGPIVSCPKLNLSRRDSDADGFPDDFERKFPGPGRAAGNPVRSRDSNDKPIVELEVFPQQLFIAGGDRAEISVSLKVDGQEADQEQVKVISDNLDFISAPDSIVVAHGVALGILGVVAGRCAVNTPCRQATIEFVTAAALAGAVIARKIVRIQQEEELKDEFELDTNIVIPAIGECPLPRDDPDAKVPVGVKAFFASKAFVIANAPRHNLYFPLEMIAKEVLFRGKINEQTNICVEVRLTAAEAEAAIRAVGINVQPLHPDAPIKGLEVLAEQEKINRDWGKTPGWLNLNLKEEDSKFVAEAILKRRPLVTNDAAILRLYNTHQVRGFLALPMNPDGFPDQITAIFPATGTTAPP